MHAPRNFWSREIVRSTVQRGLYRRDEEPSCVMFFDVGLDRYGAIISLLSLSSMPLSYALPSMIHSGSVGRQHEVEQAWTRLLSCGDAPSMVTAAGRSRASAMTKTFTLCRPG